MDSKELLARAAAYARRVHAVVPPFSASQLARARRATMVVFVVLGAVQGTLGSRMPALKDQAHLSDGLLGLALLGVPVGSILAVQVTGRWIAARGSAHPTAVGALVMSLATVVPAFATGLPSLLTALVLVGLGMGVTDAAMNAHAVTVEKAYARPIMAAFHGFASLGALLGAAGGAVAAHLGLAPAVHFPVLALLLLVTTLVARPALLPGSADAGRADGADLPPGARVSRPRARWTGPLVLLAGTALLAWMTEHAVADWSAVYLRDGLGASAGVAPYAYALFSVCMVLTRFVSDRVVTRLGPRTVLRGGGLLAGVGLAVGLLSGGVVGTTVGCGLVGVGMAGVVPIVFTAAGNLPGSHAGSAVSKVAGVAYGGSLLGPPLIGFTAQLTSLRTALLLVAAAAVVIGLAGPLALRRPRTAAGAAAPDRS